ncbi:MAG TPA: KH domain-containing protein [Candidatus Paceibacterota bacterium]|nr:KH domain-containing protein [Candidatus Paceibacterota bacterium]
MERDEQFLDYVVKVLVDHPEDVKIKRAIDEMGVLLTLSVNKDDMGKVIGRSGATAKAIRTILRIVGMKNDARVNLKIEEPEGQEHYGGNREPRPEISPENSDDSIDDVIADLKS